MNHADFNIGLCSYLEESLVEKRLQTFTKDALRYWANMNTPVRGPSLYIQCFRTGSIRLRTQHAEKNTLLKAGKLRPECRLTSNHLVRL